MFKPKFITFTGADDLTRISDMQDLAADHAVEFAILFSATRDGDARYPTGNWINEVRESGLNLAAHICGSWARQIVETGRSDMDHLMGGFARAQINTGPGADPEIIRQWADRMSAETGRLVEPILQCRGVFPDDTRVSWLFDCSGGAGVSPDAWPAPPTNPLVSYGYAGGIGPENVADVLMGLEGDHESWIDMESRIRNEDDEFDLGMCRKVCEIVASL